MIFAPYEIVRYKITDELCVVIGGDRARGTYYIQEGIEVKQYYFSFEVDEIEIEKIPEPNDILKDLCSK